MKYSSIEKKCAECGSPFIVQQYRKDEAKYCSRKCRGIAFTGKPSGAKGTKHPSATGEKNHRWVTDRTKLQHYNDDAKDRRSYAYHAWRKDVRLRDDFKCKIANPDCAGRIEVHHILGWAEHPELRYSLNNGITLCHFHHPTKRNDEIKLSPYFQGLVMGNRK